MHLCMHACVKWRDMQVAGWLARRWVELRRAVPVDQRPRYEKGTHMYGSDLRIYIQVRTRTRRRMPVCLPREH